VAADCDIDGSLSTLNKKSSGSRSGLEAVAANAALMSAVFLLGVPGWRPPRLSPDLGHGAVYSFSD